MPLVTWNADPSAYYTLMFVHPDVISRWNPTQRSYNLWTVINIPGCNVNKGDAIFGFVTGAPVEGTGYHRFVFLVFEQRGRIDYDLPYVSSR